MDVDYKSFDRDLYLSGKRDVIIKPGKSKYVKFKVKGQTTWYKYDDHTIRFYFSYYNKKYLCSTWDDDSSFKKGKNGIVHIGIRINTIIGLIEKCYVYLKWYTLRV